MDCEHGIKGHALSFVEHRRSYAALHSGFDASELIIFKGNSDPNSNVEKRCGAISCPELFLSIGLFPHV